MPSETAAISPMLLTPDEAGGACGVCAKTLYLAVKRGDLRAVRIGRRCLRYDPQDLRTWIESLKAQEISR